MNAKPLKKRGGQGFTRGVGNVRPTLVAMGNMSKNLTSASPISRIPRGLPPYPSLLPSDFGLQPLAFSP